MKVLLAFLDPIRVVFLIDTVDSVQTSKKSLGTGEFAEFRARLMRIVQVFVIHINVDSAANILLYILFFARRIVIPEVLPVNTGQSRILRPRRNLAAVEIAWKRIRRL